MKTKAQKTFEKLAFLGVNVFPEGDPETYDDPSTYLKENVNAGLGTLLGAGTGGVAGAGLAAGGAALAGLARKKPGFIKKLLGAKPKIVQTKSLSDLAVPSVLGAAGGAATGGITGGVRSIRETDRAYGVPEGKEQGLPELAARSLAAGAGLVGAGALGAKALPKLNKPNVTKKDVALDILTGLGSSIGRAKGYSVPSTNRVGQKIDRNKAQNALGTLAAAATGGVGADYGMRSAMSKNPSELETN